VSGAADALQQRRDAVRRGDLADQIDVADVDAEPREAVATSTLKRPSFSFASAASRTSFARLRGARDVLGAEAL